MDYKKYSHIVINEIYECLNMSKIDESNIKSFVETISNANNIFCDGNGRSRLKLKAFAMRLAQMGFTVYETTEVTTPAIKENDLLIICTGSGESLNLIEHMQTAHKVGAKVVAITANGDSTIARSCDYTFVIKANQKYDQDRNSVQPLATLFEQTVEIFFDSIVLVLMEQLSISNEDMNARHNLLE